MGVAFFESGVGGRRIGLCALFLVVWVVFMQVQSVLSQQVRADKSSAAGLLSQNLRKASNLSSGSGYRIDSTVQKKLNSVNQLLGQLSTLKSKLVYIRSSSEKGVHFSANSSMRANLGLRGNMADVHKELRLIGADIKSPSANQKISVEAIKENLQKLREGFESRLEVKIPTSQEVKAQQAKETRQKERSIERNEHKVHLAAVRDLYGSNEGAAWLNNMLREKSGTLRPGTTIKEPTSGDVAGFYRRSLEGTSFAFSHDKQKAVARVLNLGHTKIIELLKESLGDSEYNRYYRGAGLNRDQLDSYRCAMNRKVAVSNTYFMSVSSNQKEASAFTEARLHQQKDLHPVTYIISGSAQKFQGAFENESLFLPGSQFNVTQIAQSGSLLEISLEEVDNNQKSRNPIKI